MEGKEKVISIPNAKEGSGNPDQGKKSEVAKIEINMEDNVTFFEVDENDEAYALEDLPAEMREEIEQKNDAFIRDVIQPRLLNLSGPCSCQQNRLIQKHIRRCQLLNVNPQTSPMVLEQEDLDQLQWGLLVTSKDNVYTGVATIVRECKECHHLDFWGSSAVIVQLLAEFTAGYMTNQGQSGEFETEDVEDVEVNADHPLGDDVSLGDEDDDSDLSFEVIIEDDEAAGNNEPEL